MAFLMERLRPVAARRPASRISPRLARTALVGGMAAAGLGVAGVLLPLYLLWIVTPYVQGGSGSVVHLTACLWLLAHGAELTRLGAAGGSVPVAVTPLLVTVLVLVPLYRAGVRVGRLIDVAATESTETSEVAPSAAGPALRAAASVLLSLGAGYLLVGAAMIGAAATGGLSVDPPSAFGSVALVALPVAAVGVRVGSGAWGIRGVVPFPRERWDRWSRMVGWSRLRPSLTVPGGAGVAVRAALGAGATLLGCGALVLAVSLTAHFGAAGSIAAQIAPDLAGRLALLLLCAVLMPNAAVWGAAYALAPGFTLGGQFGPLGAADVRVPAFPLLAALPGPGRSLLGLLALAAPAAVAVVVALMVGRAADQDSHGRWGALATAEVAAAAAVGTAALAALGAAASGGALGTAALAEVGPSPWWTGLGALAWAAAGVPGALLVRWTRRRGAAQGLDLGSGLGNDLDLDAGPEPAEESADQQDWEVQDQPVVPRFARLRRISRRRAAPATPEAAASRWWHRWRRRPW